MDNLNSTFDHGSVDFNTDWKMPFPEDHLPFGTTPADFGYAVDRSGLPQIQPLNPEMDPWKEISQHLTVGQDSPAAFFQPSGGSYPHHLRQTAAIDYSSSAQIQAANGVNGQYRLQNLAPCDIFSPTSLEAPFSSPENSNIFGSQLCPDFQGVGELGSPPVAPELPTQQSSNGPWAPACRPVLQGSSSAAMLQPMVSAFFLRLTLGGRAPRVLGGFRTRPT
jgi:hypothetical protein